MVEKILELLESKKIAELHALLESMNSADIPSIFEELDDEKIVVVYRLLSKDMAEKPEDRKLINELLKYPEDSAGSIMTTEFIDLKENMTVEDAIERIRATGDDAESIYTCYVLTLKRKLLGVVYLKDIILAKKGTLVKDIMDENFIKAYTLEDQEEVANKFYSSC